MKRKTVFMCGCLIFGLLTVGLLQGMAGREPAPDVDLSAALAG